MRSVLGALGYLAREGRPDLSGPVSIPQSRFNRAQVSDILAKARTDLALPVCWIPVDQICFCVLRGCQWWGHTCRTSTSGVRDHVCGHVFAAGLAAPVTLVPWRSHRVKRVVASASAAEAVGLSEAAGVLMERRKWQTP